MYVARPALHSTVQASPLASSLTSSPSETKARRVEAIIRLDAEERGWGEGLRGPRPLQIASPNLHLLLDAVQGISAEIVGVVPQRRAPPPALSDSKPIWGGVLRPGKAGGCKAGDLAWPS